MSLLLEDGAPAQRQELPLGRWVSLVPSLSDLAFLMPVLVLFWCTTGVPWLLSDSDTGWHIRTGEWILKNGRIPATDLFSFTKFRQPWLAWEWLSDVSMAAVHRHFGLGGIALLSLLVLGVTSLCIYRSAVEESEHRLIAISFTGLAMAAGTIHWLARPHLVTPLFAAVFCWVLNRADKRPSGERFLLLLPALTILWVNLHGGFFVGTILLMTYGLGAAAEELFHGTRENAWVRARKYLFTAGACVGREPGKPLWVSPAYPHCPISRVIFLFQAHQRIPIRGLSHVYDRIFRDPARARIAAAAWHLGKGRLIHCSCC